MICDIERASTLQICQCDISSPTEADERSSTGLCIINYKPTRISSKTIFFRKVSVEFKTGVVLWNNMPYLKIHCFTLFPIRSKAHVWAHSRKWDLFRRSYSLYFRIILLVVILWLEFLCKRIILLLCTFARIVYRTLSLTFQSLNYLCKHQLAASNLDIRFSIAIFKTYLAVNQLVLFGLATNWLDF